MGDVSYPNPVITAGVVGDRLDCALVEHPYICVLVTTNIVQGVQRWYKLVAERYLDIERVKLSADDEFSIVTLKKNEIYDVR